MGSFYETAALFGLGLGAIALWKLSRLEKFLKPELKNRKQRENAEAERRKPENPRLAMPVSASPEALRFFRFYDDAIDHLNKFHAHNIFSFDNDGPLRAPAPDDRGSMPLRRILIYCGNHRAGSIELKLWDAPEFKVWADLNLWKARQYPGSEVEWLAETVAWLVVDSEQDQERVRRETLDSMARWAWQIGEDAPNWGAFGQRYEGHGKMWKADWVLTEP